MIVGLDQKLILTARIHESPLSCHTANTSRKCPAVASPLHSSIGLTVYNPLGLIVCILESMFLRTHHLYASCTSSLLGLLIECRAGVKKEGFQVRQGWKSLSRAGCSVGRWAAALTIQDPKLGQQPRILQSPQVLNRMHYIDPSTGNWISDSISL